MRSRNARSAHSSFVSTGDTKTPTIVGVFYSRELFVMMVVHYMEYSLTLNNKNISYIIRKHPRAKRVRLRVGDGGRLIVTTPLRTPHFLVTAMLRLNAGAIIASIGQFAERAVGTRISRKAAREHYAMHKETARELATARLAALNLRYGFTYKRVSIRNQKTRWGSCSKKGNLNFSYKIALMPAHLADYIIAHELCHLGAFDHSPAFWDLVAQTVPDHKAARRELRNFRLN